jgi:hypothetical protein
MIITAKGGAKNEQSMIISQCGADSESSAVLVALRVMTCIAALPLFHDAWSCLLATEEEKLRSNAHNKICKTSGLSQLH